MELDTILSEARASGISIGQIERTAGFSSRYLSKLLNGKRAVSRPLLLRVRFALSRIRRTEPVDEAQASAGYRLAVAHVALFYKVEPGQILGQQPGRRATSDKSWMAAARMRRLALYIASVHLNISGAELARAANLSPAAVSIALNAIEDDRDNPDLEALLGPVEQALIA